MPDAFSEPVQCRRSDSLKYQEKQQIGYEDGKKAVDNRADSKSLSPKERIHCSFGHVLQFVDRDGRFEEKSSGPNIHVEDDRPDKGESAPAHQSGDQAPAAQACEETSKNTPQAEGRLKIAGQADGKTSGSLLASSAQPEKPNRLVKQDVSHSVSTPCKHAASSSFRLCGQGESQVAIFRN